MSKKVQTPSSVEKYSSPQCVSYHITPESAVLTDSYSASREEIGGLDGFGGWDPDGLFIL
jgi:hypothetical protein